MPAMVLDDTCIINERYKIIETINRGKYSLLYKVQDIEDKNEM